MYFTRPKIQNTEKGDNRKGDGKNIGFLQRHMFQENPSRTIFLEKRDRNAAATSSTRQEEKKYSYLTIPSLYYMVWQWHTVS